MEHYIQSSNFDKTLDYTINSYSDKHADLCLNIQEKHLNFYGYVHGGVYYSLSDAACGFIVLSFEKANWVTLNGAIQYIKAAKKGSLNVKASLISKSRKTATIQVDIYQNDTLCTKGNFTMYKID